MTSTPRALIRGGADRLEAAGLTRDEARSDARTLFLLAAETDAASLIRFERDTVLPDVAERYASLLDRRALREPISHIAGEVWFWGRRFACDRRALAPRADSECLIAKALDRSTYEGKPPARIADLGTGTGCLILTLLAEWPVAEGVGIDLSADALALARENAERHGVGSRLSLRCGNWLEGSEGLFDLIVSNPPYIATPVLSTLDPEVREVDPVLALDGGADGLDAYRALLPQAFSHLAEGGGLIVEIGYDQAEPVSDLMARAGFVAITVGLDLGGRDRIVSGIRRG